MHVCVEARLVDVDAICDAFQTIVYHEPLHIPDQRTLLLCSETSHFRKAASIITPGVSVLEIGCSFGDTTLQLAKSAKLVTAVDNSQSCVERAQERCTGAGRSDVRCVVSDVVANPSQVLALGQDVKAAVIFIDIGGNRAFEAITSAVLLLLQQLRPVLMVVKSRELSAAAWRHIVTYGDAGGPVLPAQRSFWVEARTHATRFTPDVLIEGDVAESSRVPPDETRICFAFANRGCCKLAKCTFRHVGPSHPDWIADAAKRSQVGWQPEKRRRPIGAVLTDDTADRLQVTPASSAGQSEQGTAHSTAAQLSVAKSALPNE